MTEYAVTLTAVINVDTTVHIKANSPEEAEELAMQADNLTWSSSDNGKRIGEIEVYDLAAESVEEVEA